jgi:hypothetical protein
MTGLCESSKDGNSGAIEHGAELYSVSGVAPLDRDSNTDLQ